jgi:DNA-binding response OmpR family regulator
MEVAFAASPSRALKTLDGSSCDVIVLDSSSLPARADQLCTELRRKEPLARLILLTNDPDISSLSYDYLLTTPVSWKRLLSTIQEALSAERRQVLTAGDFTLDLVEQIVVGPAGEKRLTPKLFQLLHLLMSHAGELVQRRMIMVEVWHTSFMDDTRTLDVHISWLRKAIEPEPQKPRYLVTQRGQGYLLYPDGLPEESP